MRSSVVSETDFTVAVMVENDEGRSSRTLSTVLPCLGWCGGSIVQCNQNDLTLPETIFEASHLKTNHCANAISDAISDPSATHGEQEYT